MKKYLFLCVFFFLFAGVSFSADVSNKPQVLSSGGNGRFVFGQVSEFRKDQYMLDTQTGSLWQIQGSNDILRLVPIFYQNGGKIDKDSSSLKIIYSTTPPEQPDYYLESLPLKEKK